MYNIGNFFSTHRLKIKIFKLGHFTSEFREALTLPKRLSKKTKKQTP